MGSSSGAVRGGKPPSGNVDKKIVSLVMERKPAFVLSTGDMIAKTGDKDHGETSGLVTVSYLLAVGNLDADPMVLISEKVFDILLSLKTEDSRIRHCNY